MHGGAAATALDSVLGFCCLRSQGFGCYTLNLNVNYRYCADFFCSLRNVRENRIKSINIKKQTRNGKNISFCILIFVTIQCLMFLLLKNVVLTIFWNLENSFHLEAL